MKQCKIYEFVIKQYEWHELIKKQNKAELMKEGHDLLTKQDT